MVDWKHWLTRYDRPQSPHSRRLATVQRLIARRLDRLAPQPTSVLSICAGDGRDILDVLAERDDASRVEVTLVELDARLCALARARAAEAGLARIDVRQADAGATDTYVGVPPADLVLLVGVFGNISDAGVRSMIETLPSLCAAGALVIWSLRQMPRRGQAGNLRMNDRDRVDRVREWFAAAGFAEVFGNRADVAFFVGVNRFVARPRSLRAGRKIFAFDGAPEDATTEVVSLGS